MTNLLDLRYLGPTLRSAWTWRLLRTAMLALLVLMIVSGWSHHSVPGVPVRDPLMYVNLATFILWVVWIMGLVGVALLLGRSWCTICPVGWVNGLVSRLGLRRELPRWLRGFVPVTLVLLLLQLLVYFFAIHRYPDYSARLLFAMLVLAVAAGLIFKRRAFCLLFCPAGVVSGLYARMAPWALRVKDVTVCDDCLDKPCIATAKIVRRAALGRRSVTWATHAEGCPVDLVPARIEHSADCTLCLNCTQTCCNDNLQLGPRGWFEDLGPAGLRPGETFFFLVLLGLLTANFVKVYVDLREAVFWVPDRLTLALGWEAAGFYLLAVVWITLLLPLLLLLPGLVVYLSGQVRITTVTEPTADARPPADGEAVTARRFWSLTGRLSMTALPLVLTAHLVLAVVKLNAKLGYLPLVLQDPTGVKSYLAMNVVNTLPPPGGLLSLELLKWLIVALLAAGLFASCHIAWRLAARKDREKRVVDKSFLGASLVTALVLLAFYGTTVFEWLFVR